VRVRRRRRPRPRIASRRAASTEARPWHVWPWERPCASSARASARVPTRVTRLVLPTRYEDNGLQRGAVPARVGSRSARRLTGLCVECADDARWSRDGKLCRSAGLTRGSFGAQSSPHGRTVTLTARPRGSGAALGCSPPSRCRESGPVPPPTACAADAD
jgi:hypothetical protein